VRSVLVLEDFAMAAYLPVLTVLAVGGTGWQAALGMFIAVAAVAGAFAVTQRWGPLIGRLLSHPEPEQLLLRVLGTTLVVAGLAELVGASAAGRGVPRRAHPHRPTHSLPEPAPS
jgi:monovalent cation:H+ antiporter-2, CPA2 family